MTLSWLPAATTVAEARPPTPAIPPAIAANSGLWPSMVRLARRLLMGSVLARNENQVNGWLWSHSSEHGECHELQEALDRVGTR